MKLKNILMSILIIVLFLLTNVYYANGWTQKKGSLYFQLGSRITVADKFYEPGGNKIDITTIGDYTFSVYAAFGITGNLTVFGSFPFKRLVLNRVEGKNSGNEFFPGDTKTGIADFNIGIKYGLGRIGSTSFAVQLGFGIPVGDNQQVNGLFTGDGELNQHIAIGFGHSFNGPVYIAGKVGFNNRVNDFSDEFKYNFEIGYRVSKSLLLMLKTDGVETLRNGTDESIGSAGGLFANNQNYLAYGPEVIYSLTEFVGLNVGIYSATRAENVVSGLAYKAGIFLKFN